MTNTETYAFHPVRLLPLEHVQDTIVTAEIPVPYQTYDEMNTIASPTKRSFNNNFGTIAVRASLAILAFGGSIGFMKENKTAHAATHDATYQIVDGLWYVHASEPTIHSQTVGLAYPGDTITITCHEHGDDVYGDAEWDRIVDQNNGLEGFVADYGTNTPVQRGQETTQLTELGIPACGAGASGGQENIPQPVNPEYNRTNAVNWALAHAQDPQTNGEECTKFVSEALWAGGLPEASEWYSHGYYESRGTVFAGSKTANSAPMLINYLEDHYSTQLIQLGTMNAGNNNVPQSEPGDIMIYSWNGENSDHSPKNMDHLAFVVGSATDNPQYPMVAEWGQFADYNYFTNYLAENNLVSPYVERGWTYSEMNHMYLQKEYPNMTVYLLHFNGGSLLPNY